jgi:hypothetical protein
MKTNLELETVEVLKVKLDIYFEYHRDYGFEIHSIEDITGTQDLTPVIDQYYLELITDELRELYRKREWL